jgi:hypothetical protein
MEEDLEVAGIPHRKRAAIAFAKGKQHRLELEPEPKNPHDRNAIRVIGISKGWFFWHRRLLGYVPQETAERIVGAGLMKVILPRLKSIFVGEYPQPVIHVRFDLLRPKLAKEPRKKDKKRSS